MTVHKLRQTLQDFAEHMIGKTIEGVGFEDGDLCITLSDGSEVIVWSDEDLAMTLNDTGVAH
jgi:hypothetical protein